MIQIYYGFGKGKTTAAIGQGVRAKGSGMNVLLVQFLKDNKSSELKELKKLEFDVFEAPDFLPFNPGDFYKEWVDSALNYIKNSNADMIILVRKIEDLQQRTVDLYYNYMTARKKLKMIEQITADRKKNYDFAQSMSKEVVLMTDAYYRTALDNQMKARSDYYAKRASLEQFVGNETFAQFEKDLKEREKVDSEK